jgi:RNA polymerase sigma-70 factor, ECF subfamily
MGDHKLAALGDTEGWMPPIEVSRRAAEPPGPGAATVSQLRAVFDAHADHVMRTLRYLGVPPPEIDDAFQEVFMVVHVRLHELRSPAAVRAWLREIARRVALASRRRRAQRLDDARLPPEPVDPRPTPETAHEKRDMLLHLLDGLSDEQRDTFVLYELEEMSMREVAEAMGCPLQTAYSRYNAAREKLTSAAARLGGRHG